MAWKCPECGIKNDSAAECSCGYAFYKILGVKPDASEKSVKQTYQYLLNVWKTDSLSSDPLSQKKADERLKKINEAYKTFKDYASSRSGTKKKTNTVKVASFAVLIVLFFAFLLVFLNTSKEDKPREQTTTQQAEKAKTQPLSVDQVNMQDKPEEPLPSAPTANLPAGISLEKTEENAIGLVKKSHVLDRFSDVETIMNKWTDENSGKFQIIGWKVKKMDEQIYLVSYTASDGLVTKGFYFDIDFSTGAVRHIANHPELQKKYGIQYNQ